MICENTFNKVIEKAKAHKYSSMNYIEFDDCKNSEILHENDDLILMRDNSKTPAMLHFAANDFESLIEVIAGLPGKLRMHFVPKEYAGKLSELGFIEWGEYVDFWNNDLAKTARRLSNVDEPEYLDVESCEEASTVTRSCKLQSRGFEGMPADEYKKWLENNKVIVVREDTLIAGICCVSIYNEGTTLWIKEIAVAPKYQGLGLGKKLMEQSIKYGSVNGADKGFLLADILNENAHRLYNKYDFHAKDDESELQMIRK